MSLELIESAELSDLGLKRTNNEDACLRIPQKGVYCVADGMGGGTGGDLASKTIISHVQEAFEKAAPEQCATLSDVVRLLDAAVNKASKWIRDFADEKVIGQMGSTMVGLVFDPRNPSRAVVLHAGDSRLYRWREGRLEQLTADHTAAAVLAATLGRDPSSLPARFHNELARAVGLRESVELEECSVEARTGDMFLLCSDGLPRMVPDPEIGEVFANADQADLAALSRTLVGKANEAGGRDNVTVVVLRVGDLGGLVNVKPEPDYQPKSLALLAAEREAARADQDTPSPPTPETVRDDRAYTQTRPETPQPPPIPLAPPSAAPPMGIPQSPRTSYISQAMAGAAPPREVPPSPKPPTRSRGPAIAVGLVVLAAGILAVLHFIPARQPETPITTNILPPNPPSNNVAPALPPPRPLPPPTGGLVIQSDAVGADVYSHGQKVGQTPYEIEGLQPGPLTYQLGSFLRTGMVTMTVVAGETNRTNVNLTPRTGTLAVNSDPPKAEVWVGGARVGYTPFSSNWDAGDFQLALKFPPLKEIQVPLTLAADTSRQTNVSFAYGGMEIKSDPAGADVLLNGRMAGLTPFTTNLQVPGPMSLLLRLTNYEPSAAMVQVPEDHSLAQTNIHLRPVLVAPPVAFVPAAPTHVGGRGRVWTNQVGVLWTNDRYGIAFLKMPTNEFWIAMARVTPNQFNQVAGDDKQLIPEVRLDKAESFATKLTAVLKENNEFPPGCETWRLAVPTPDEWLSATAIKSLEMKKETGHEWCWIPERKEMFAADFNTDRNKFVAGRVIQEDVPSSGWALRLVLVPPAQPTP